MKSSVRKLLDNQNKELWSKLNKKFDISFSPSNDGTYGCYSQNNKVEFIVDYNNLSPASFTHEMLHVYFRLKDCYIGAGIKNSILSDNRLGKVFSFELMEHIGNCLEHIKMLPVYLEMGYERESFLSDYHENKCTKKELNLLVKNYRIGKKISSDGADYFIGKLISMIADPNESYDYTNEMETLRTLDPGLYEVVFNLCNHWDEVDIESNDIMSTSYNEVVCDFSDNLERWYFDNDIALV